MSNYLIEGVVNFSPEKCHLKRNDVGEEVSLSFIASGVLELLMINQGSVVTRETIFKEIFDKNSVSTTNNNLNQYISHLRKQFSYLGLDLEIIQTVPKIGFMIPSTLSISTNTDELGQVIISEPEINEISNAHSMFKFNSNKVYIFCFVWVVILCSISIYNFLSSNIDWIPEATFSQRHSNIKHACEVYSLSGDSSVTNSTVPGYVNNIDTFVEQTCHAGNLIFFIDEHSWSAKKSRLFILQCPKGEDSAKCTSSYISVER